MSIRIILKSMDVPDILSLYHLRKQVSYFLN